METWIVVADSSQARVFACSGPSIPLTEIEVMIHPHSRLKGREMLSDRPGVIAGGTGEGSKMFEPRTDLKEHESTIFAHAIIERLEEGRVNGSFKNLIVSAPPHFLGILKKHMKPHLQGLVSLFLNKSLVQFKESSIRDQVFQRKLFDAD